MVTTQEMRVSSFAALAWIVMLGMTAWVIGVYPTYHLAGKDGLVAQAVASVVVLIVTWGSAVVITKFASRGPKAAAMALLLSGFAKMILVVVAVLMLRMMFDLPLIALMIWMGLFYVAMLAGELIWLSRALSRDAFLVALGDITREPVSKPDAINEIT
ncbi:MAG: hypothetical protein GY794_05125 [bacterium]|nr:hypothetical protein [bacterium]